MIEPLPCPFCGGTKLLIVDGKNTWHAYYSRGECADCGATCGDVPLAKVKPLNAQTIRAAVVAKWNTRHKGE